MKTLSDKLGIDVVHAGGIVRVRDGADTWLCREDAWDAAVDSLPVALAAPEVDDEVADAYQAVCDKVRGDVASINGTSNGDWYSLVREAVETGLIEADDAVAFGVQS